MPNLLTIPYSTIPYHTIPYYTILNYDDEQVASMLNLFLGHVMLYWHRFVLTQQTYRRVLGTGIEPEPEPELEAEEYVAPDPHPEAAAAVVNRTVDSAGELILKLLL